MSWKSSLSSSASSAAAGLKNAGSSLKSAGSSAYAWTAPRAKTASAKTWNGVKTGAKYGKKGAQAGATYGKKGAKYGGKGALVAGKYGGKGLKYGATRTGDVVRESGELSDYLERVDDGAVANPTVTDLYQNVRDTEPEAMIELLEAGDIDTTSAEITVDDDVYNEIRRGSYGRRVNNMVDSVLGTTLECMVNDQYDEAADDAESNTLQQNVQQADRYDKKTNYGLAGSTAVTAAGAAFGPTALIGLPAFAATASMNPIWQEMRDAYAEEAADQIEDRYGGYSIDIVP